ncbi:RNA polymerase sigma factor SigM [Gemmata sp. SH-PL17]|uniref:sigma-70 family RNA polymerase sigma factor n=1 Tax=Gemmata sp. SH-PL17 TaxID=1630693 RepID=UPI0004B71406|nr:sigma-70 family RNA polymerase sigma factor [Gemmata sp. SH-PL17]AMV25721.1 RNA polymerase sigma factor SigM [Gemmata sp. SH-PL17]
MIDTGTELDRYRPLLRLHVRQLQLGRLYRARFDSSDVVQESLLRAFKGIDQVRGRSEAEFVGWLQKVVAHTVIDLVREHSAAKRDPGLERTLCDAVDDDETPLGAYLTATEPGPSAQAVRKEELLCLAAALDRLPEAERDAVIAHYILELPLAETATRLGRTTRGVGGLLFRGKRRLSALLAAPEDLA